jgi:hypothetical protein
VRVLILCAGEGSRWNNYTGVPKHQVVIEDEILVERTVKQFLKYTDDIVVVYNDDSYKIPGTLSYKANIKESNNIMDKFLSSHNQWSDTKTIIVFGDVYFTDEAVDSIATNDREWCFFLRRDASKITGKPWGEIFALSFNASFNKKMLENLVNLVFMQTSSNPMFAAGWMLLGYLLKVERIEKIFTPENGYSYVSIDDWTDDFDYPQDYDCWIDNRKLYFTDKN